MICTLGGPIGKSRHFRESVNELEIFMQGQKSKPICCEDYFASFFLYFKNFVAIKICTYTYFEILCQMAVSEQ